MRKEEEIKLIKQRISALEIKIDELEKKIVEEVIKKLRYDRKVRNKIS